MSRVEQNRPGPALDLQRFRILQQGSARCRMFRKVQEGSDELRVLLLEPQVVGRIAVQDVLVAHSVCCIKVVSLEDDLAPERSRSGADPLNDFERARVRKMLYCKFHASSFVAFSLSRVTVRISLRISLRYCAGRSRIRLTKNDSK